MTSARTYSEAELPVIGAAIAKVLRAGDVIGLTGELGAGKTSLARAILHALGYVGDVPSPSFAIIQPYEPPDVQVATWHVDLYRLDDPADVAELGLAEARVDHALLIEWPDRLGMRWPDMLMLQIAGEGPMRRLTADVPPAWNERWTLT
jgi:tRNA threonylcarbamoyladenosine biosynthesis protein TsaE